MIKKVFIFLISILVLILLFFYLEKNKTYGFFVENERLKSIFEDKKEFNEKYLFIYFGYLKCKTFCPSSIGLMKQISDNQKTNDINFVFISLDKKNDSKEKLDEYQKNFDTRFYFYISNEKIATDLIEIFKIQFSENFFEKNPTHHSSNLYLVHKNKTKYIIYPSNYTEVTKIINDKNSF